jgi:hypothetical protein
LEARSKVVRRISPFLCALSFVGFLAAQQGPLQGPVEGFLFDPPTRSLRAVTGSLGSALLGEALLKGLDYGSVGPHRNYAIAFHDGACVLVTGLDSGQVSMTTISESFPVPDAMAWSGDGSVAVAYSRTRNWIRTIKGLPHDPQAGYSFEIESLSSVAVDFHGRQVAIGVGGERAGVYRMGDGMPLLSGSRPISLAFAENDRILFALEEETRQLSVLDITNFTVDHWPVETLENPYAVRSARDASHREIVYVAGREDRALLVLDAASGQVLDNISLSAPPTAIEPLGRYSFLLGSRTSDRHPVWSFSNLARPALLFIPGAMGESREETGQ